jgi:gliding motility-associated-like protein
MGQIQIKKNIVFQHLVASVLALLISCLNGEFSNAQTAAEVKVVNFDKSGEVVLNPGQGWILYGAPSTQSTATVEMGTTGYERFNWSDLNPAEGVYNWTRLDNSITQWAQRGKQFSFGVMNVNTSGNMYYCTPKWVFDKGAKYTMGHDEANINHGSDMSKLKYYIPVWDDPIYVAACKKFIEALAARYNGNPNIAFIDIRNYGNWGEMHMYPFESHTKHLTDEKVQNLLFKPYRDNFTETKLVICWAQPPLTTTNRWIVDNGMGLRRDGIMGQYNEEGAEIVMAAGKEPIVWEFIDAYRNLENSSSRPWDDEKFLRIIKTNKPNYIGMGHWGDDAQYMLRRKPELVKKVANLMGYHFAMTRAKYTSLLEAGELKEITVSIENAGVTTMLTDCVIKLVLLNEKDEVVSSFKTNWNAKQFKAGEITELRANVGFANAPTGTYRLAIGLYMKENDRTPTYRMENKNRTVNGFYVIGDLRIIDKCKGENIEAAEGETSLCNELSLLYNIAETININDVETVAWTISPPDACVVQSVSGTKGEAVTVEWKPNFQSSMAEISYSVRMNDGSKCLSKPLIINLEHDDVRPPSPEGPVEIMDETRSVYTAGGDWDGYEWKITPAAAGTVTISGNSARISWAGGRRRSYAGEVEISYRISRMNNNCGFSEFSPALSVTLLPKPPVTSENNPCAGVSTVFEMQPYDNVSSYQWVVDPSYAGTVISQANTATINWSPDFSGGANVSCSVTTTTGRVYSSESVPVNVRPLPVAPDIAGGPTSVNWNVSESTLTANPGGDNYEWQILPAVAGTITAKSNSASIRWAGEKEHSYAGQVQVSYRIAKTNNNCGYSEYSPVLFIELLPKQPTALDNNPCAGTSTIFETRSYDNVSSYQWSMKPLHAGTIVSRENTATVNWSSDFSGEANISYSITDTSGRIYTSEPVSVNVRALPATPDMAGGSTSVAWDVFSSTYNANSQGNSYEWKITPAAAGTVMANGSSARVRWAGGRNHSYAGQVQLSYRVAETGNRCGLSEYSPALSVDLLPKPPVTSETNPCAGTVTVFGMQSYENTLSYQWMIEPSSAGTAVNQANTATVNWSSDFSGEANVSCSVMDTAGRVYRPSESVRVNVRALPATPDMAGGPTSVAWSVVTSTYRANSRGNSYEWKITPATAGTVTANGRSAGIRWAGDNEHSYAGQVQISYRIAETGNRCGFSEYSPALSVDLLPRPPVTSETNPCAGTVTIFETQSYENTLSYQWVVEPSSAGTAVNQANTATVNWSSDFSGEANVFCSVADTAGRVYPSESARVNVRALPATPNIAGGPTSVNWNVPESTLTANPGGDNYEWRIFPATAGTITVDGNSATIHWTGGTEHSYAGQVQVSYRIAKTDNNCGFSEYSPVLSIDLLPKPPVTSDEHPCTGAGTVFETLTYENASSYQWMVDPSHAGTVVNHVNMPNTATINWSSHFSGEANVSCSVTDTAGRVYPSDPVPVNVRALPATPDMAGGQDSVDWDVPVSTYIADPGGNSYEWKVSPDTAVTTITVDGNSATVHWAGGDIHSYAGRVEVSYKMTTAGNHCGFSEFSPALQVYLLPRPPVTQDMNPCAGTYSIFEASLYPGVSSYQWTVEPENAAETITNRGANVLVTWSPAFSGQASVFYTVKDALNKIYASSPVQVEVQPLSVVSGTAAGPSFVSWNETASVFEVAVQDTTDKRGYQWSLTPKAGEFSAPDDTSLLTVTWDHQYVGTVLVSYRAHNGCGWSTPSLALPVVLRPAPPEISGEEPCSGTSSTVSAPAYKNATAYSWKLEPANAGNITGRANSITIAWSPAFSGEASVSYSVKDAMGGNYLSSSVQVAVQPLPATPEIAAGPSSVSGDETTSVFTVAASATTDGQGYQWSLDPVAGTIALSGGASQATVTWNRQYVGTVLVSYRAHNACGWSLSSPVLPVALQPAPPEISGKEPCSGTSLTVSAPAYKNARGYRWTLVPAFAGTVTGQGNTATIVWSPDFSGPVDVSYSVIDIEGRTHISSDVQVTVQPLPATPGRATGPSSVSWNETASVFAVAASAATDEQGYQWSLTPEAGTFSASGDVNTVAVDWDRRYIGTVHITYKTHNSCGWSLPSSILPVVLQLSPPEISGKELCNGTSSTVSAPVYENAREYTWTLLPINAGTITPQANAATIAWSPAFSGEASISYSVKDIAGGIHTSSKVQVTVQPLPVTPGVATGPSIVSWDQTASVFAVSASATTDELGYQWSLTPEAGTFSSPGDAGTITVDWDRLYTGTVHVTYRTHNGCGWSAPSPALPVVLQPGPPEISDKEPCNGTSSIVSAPVYKNAKVYSWNLAPVNAGTVTKQANGATIVWSPDFSGPVDISCLVEDAAGRTYISHPVSVSVQTVPAQMETAVGPPSVEWNETASTFRVAASASTDEQGYQWALSPEAGTFSSSGDANPVTVTWNRRYAGTVHVTYRAHNRCGWSKPSRALSVILYPAPPEIDDKEPCSGASSTVSAHVYENVDRYTWKLSPDFVGTVSENNGNRATISWNPLLTGETVTVECTFMVGTERYSSSTQIRLQPLPEPLLKASGNVTVEYSEATTVYTAPDGWKEYRWEISPVEAYTAVQEDENRLSVFWAKNYTGKVGISYKIRNDCGWSPNSSPALVATLLPALPVIDRTEACNNTGITVSSPPYQNVSAYRWRISPSAAGHIDGNGSQATVLWNSLYEGEVEISYTVVISPQESYSSSPVSALVRGVLPQPSAATGPDRVFLNTPLETYRASSAGMQYEWRIIPSQAAEIKDVTGETVSIVWGPAHLGEAMVEYRIGNECGWSEMSKPLQVQIFRSDLLEDIPEIFTPNGDGFNDTWDIPALYRYPGAVIRIYNRAKKLMVEFRGSRMPWDGQDANGNILESGNYLYQIDLQKGGKTVAGYVTILR